MSAARDFGPFEEEFKAAVRLYSRAEYAGHKVHTFQVRHDALKYCEDH
jgi:hypothetical protein